MAAVEQLQSEVLCSVCLDYFREPVSIACGHNFCRACIELWWGKAAGSAEGNFLCPQCREPVQDRNFRPNRELGNVVELVKRLNLESAAEAPPVPKAPPAAEAPPAAKGVCTRHQEPLKLFCQEDETPICVICRESRDHSSHKALPIEEAVQEYKKQIQSKLQELKSERETLIEWQLGGEITMTEHLEKIEMERDAVVKEFDQLHQFEQEQKNSFLDQLKELQKQAKNEQKWRVEDVDHLNILIRDMEKIYDLSDNEFLQDIKSTLSRAKNYDMPLRLSCVTQDLAAFSQKNTALKMTLKNFAETFTSELKKNESQQNTTKLKEHESQQCTAKVNTNKTRKNMSKSKWIKEDVLLDPETAHPRYIVSADRKTVRWGDSRRQFPYNEKRFECVRCVLGCEGFTSGKHYWTVDVGDGDYWAVGVAKESVEREEEIDLVPDEGIWAIGLYNDQYKALTSPPTLLEVEDEPAEIQVSLNYEGGTVTFYDAEDRTRLFTFQSVDFEGEEIFPFFRIIDSSTVLKLYS